MSILSDAFDSASNAVGTVLRNLSPFFQQLITWLNTAQEWTNNIITSAQNLGLPDYLKGPVVVLAYIPYLIITVLITIANWIVSFIKFFVDNPDTVTYILLAAVILLIEELEFVKERLTFIPNSEMIPVITFWILLLPLPVFAWYYYTNGQNGLTAVASTKTFFFNFSPSVITNNLDVSIYLGLLIFVSIISYSPEFLILGYNIHDLPQFVFGFGLLILLYPIILLLYYMFGQGQELSTAVSSVRNNALGLITSNLDLIIYFSIIGFIIGFFLDNELQQTIEAFIPEFVLLGIGTLMVLVLAIPIGFIIYYWFTQTKTPVTESISNAFAPSVLPTDLGSVIDQSSTPPPPTSVGFLEAVGLFRQDIRNVISKFSINTVTSNVDIVIYLAILAFMIYITLNPELSIFGFEITQLPKFIFAGILLVLAYPIVLLVYYMWNQGQNFSTALASVRANAIWLIINNLDVSIYLAIWAVMSYLSVEPEILGYNIQDLPQFVFAGILLVLLYPILLLMYYILGQGQDFPTAFQNVRKNAFSFITSNLDVIIYFAFWAGFIFYLTNEGAQDLAKSLMPGYVLINLLILYFVLLMFPIGVSVYYVATQTTTPLTSTWSTWLGGTAPNGTTSTLTSVSFFDGVQLYRTDVNNVLINLGFVQPPAPPVTGGGSGSSGGGPTQEQNAQNALQRLSQLIQNAFTALQNALTSLTANISIADDPNPGLTDTERMFFAQLYSDNPATYPASIYYPASINNYTGSYVAILPNPNISYQTRPKTYDKVLYEDLNLEFYNNSQYKRSLYSEFFGQTMTRADYISVPYLSLSGKTIDTLGNGVTISDTLLNKFITLCFDVMNLLNSDGSWQYKTVSSVPDYVLQSYASGLDCAPTPVAYNPNGYNPTFVCYDAINARSQYTADAPGTIWPSASVRALLWPTISSSDIKDPNTQAPIIGTPTAAQIANCNQAFIYHSFTELINNLSSVTSGYLESVERWNIYLQIWGADNLSNPNFIKSPGDLGSYVYTYANMSKNIVMFNDFLSYSILPTGESNAAATQSFNLGNAYSAGIYNQIQISSNPNSSSLLFAAANIVLELISSGMSLSSVIGLYNNVRETNANFLFNRDSNPNNLAAPSNANLAYIPVPLGTSSYSPDVLNSIDEANQAAANGTLVGSNLVQATAQIQTVLNSFASTVDKNKIAQALNDAPSVSGGTQDYGSPYIRRMFYDAAGLLSSIYSDLFMILKRNVFFAGNQYTPVANDPLDMSWFRYTVQNWNNSFDGTQFGDGSYDPNTDGIDGCNSYICGGYKDGTMHVTQVKAVLAAIDQIIFTNSGLNNYVGIYDRIFSLLDYIVSYNNIVNKAFTIGLLGSSAGNNLQNLINNLSNRYLRLNQNNRYMDLTSLLPNNIYQHYHINLDLAVPKFAVNPSIGSTTIRNISSVADLTTWLSNNVSQDPAYTAFKNEVATFFVYKVVWDMVWWPQFCTEFYYCNQAPNSTFSGITPLVRYSYWNNTATAPKNHTIINTIAQGGLSYGFWSIFQDYGNIRLQSQYFTSAICPNLANMINGVYPAGYATGLVDRGGGAARSDSLAAVNTFYWKSICYSHMHDLIIPYVFFTSTILPNYTTKTGPQNYSGINFTGGDAATVLYNDLYYQYYGDNGLLGIPARRYPNNMALVGSWVAPNLSYNNAISSYRWLSNYTCIGSNTSGSRFPKQMIFDKTINPNASYIDSFYGTVYDGSYTGVIPPSSMLFTKFNAMAKDRNTIRKQFFADPFSWFDTSKAYRIYPIAHGMDISGNYEATGSTTNWLTQDINPMRNTFLWLSVPGLYYRLGSSWFTSNVNSYDYSTAYAPIQDISMVSG